MTLAWIDTTAVDEFAQRLIRVCVERVSPASLEAGGKKLDGWMKRNRDLLLRQTIEFTLSHELNIYKKARLANRLKWGLLDSGYPQAFVDEVAYEVASVMASVKKPAGAARKP